MKNSVAKIIQYSVLVALLLIALIVGLILNSYRDNRWVKSPSVEKFATEEAHSISNLSGIDPTYRYPADEIHNLDIDWASGLITLEAGDTQEVLLAGSGADAMSVKHSGNTLKLQYPQNHSGLSLSSQNKDLHILVPRDWECKELTVDCASASVRVANGTIHEVDINAASGTSSFENCTLRSLDIDTASGNVIFDGTLNEFECNAASANVELRIHNCPNRVEMESISGDLTLYLPNDCGFLVDHQTVSGKFRSELPITTRANQGIRGDGTCKIDFEGLSASLTIKDGKETVHHSETDADHRDGSKTHK